MPLDPLPAVYLIHHSHTDVGYTHDQPVVWDLYRRFLDQAIDLCVADADRNGDDCFRWTVETTAPLLRWLQTAPPARRRLLADLCRLGRIEVTAMPVNVTPLYDTAELAEALRPVRAIREELGIAVRYAMNSDVNGQNWPLVDVLLDAGIEALSMAINVDHGGAPPGRPNAFLWEGPSGRRILAWNGWSYGFAWGLGIGHSAERLAERWPRVHEHLVALGSPLPAVMMQLFSGFGDNGPPVPELAAFVRAWNAAGRAPHLVVATPAQWWASVRPHTEHLPVWRGDWTDFWNFGAGSSALETAINRASRGRLHAADRAAAAVRAMAPISVPAPARTPGREARERAAFALHLWDEHTWGADCSVSRPDDEDTVAQWQHKAAYAYEARSLSVMLRRDAVAELTRAVARTDADALLVFNPAPCARQVAGPVPDWRPSAQRGGAGDPTAARHFQDRLLRGAGDYLPPIEVPGLGYAVVPAAALRPAGPPHVSADETVACGRFQITFDVEHGGIRSWLDRDLGQEMVDARAPWPLHGFVHERPAGDPGSGRERIWSWPAAGSREWDRGWREWDRGWHPGWEAERRGPTRVVEHRVERTPVGVRVVQRLDAHGVRGLTQVTTLVDGLDTLWLESRWHMEDTPAVEATYLAFPLALAGAEVRYDVGGQAVRPEADQIPGACRDFYNVQNWVDLSGTGAGVTVGCPDTPLWQFGGFTFGGNAQTFSLAAPLLLAWVTNNYWHTNFRAAQPGPVYARFALRPHRGPFDEGEAHRLGAEVALEPIFQHLGEPPIAAGLLPPRGSLLRGPEPPVLLLGLHPDPDGSTLAGLLNASDAPAEATLAPGVLGIRRAVRTDGVGAAQAVLPLDGAGAVRLALGPRRLATVRLWLEPAAVARRPGMV